MNDHESRYAHLAITEVVADLSRLDRTHSGPRHHFYRGRISDTSVVVKARAAPSNEDAFDSVRHEYEILRGLTLPGTVRAIGAVPTEHHSLTLVMEDAGDTNLAALVRSGRLPVGVFLDIAVQLADVVAGLHEARVIHRDIRPGNIIWDSKTRVATVCDFAAATTWPTLAMESSYSCQHNGSLSYMSPEQTGRTRRPVDWRTDLYSLGATLYELLTGAPPFGHGDPVALAHAHIARKPKPPHELNPQAPPALSQIVLKLLEKEPELRYQSATALAHDLREAADQWHRSATIAPFTLAIRDIPGGLNIPDKLYGRDEDVHALADAFERACAGGHEFILVTGGPGIGKSALVEQLRQSVVARDGFYVAGKFDQLQRSIPFSALAQALRGLVRQLLTESDPVLARWRKEIEEAIAPNGQLLVDILPELAGILGPQPPVREVGPLEARNRFHALVTRFLRVFAQPAHPLVLFLDDLQWVDAASLQLFEQWVGDAASHHLLIVAAYRDSEVGPSHPLALSLAALREVGTHIHAIHLGPLDSRAVADLAADTFGEDVARTRFLADLIIRRSAGNPFFVRRLLHLMHAQDLFRFDATSRRWTWDESRIAQAPLTGNVLELMVQAIGRLPAPTQRLLEMGACVGHQFDFATVADLSDTSLSAVTEQLWPAVQDGLLVPVQGAERWASRPGAPGRASDQAQTVLQFAHDRVQQAAYSLLNEQSRRQLHHAIGLRLLEQAGQETDENLFEIVDQLTLGDSAGKAAGVSLVELYLAAGYKAKASAAYRAAFDYFAMARRHLGDQAWERLPDITFAVYRELAESAYLCGEHATAEELVETSMEHAPSRIAKAELYGLRVLAATVAGDWARALRWGREGLSVFGQEWPLDGLPEAIELEANAVMRNLRERDIADLVADPEVGDSEIRASMRLISILGAPAYFSGSEVLIFLVTRAANLSLTYGPSPYSAFAYTFYGGIHNMRTGRYDVGYAFGRLALALAERFGNRAEESRTVEVFGVLVHGWKAPLRDSLPLLKEGFRAGVDSGELAFAAFNLNSVLINALPAGLPLDELLAEAQVTLDFASAQKNKTSSEIALPFAQIARALMGATAQPDVFDDEHFSEARFLEEASSHETALGHYWVAKLQLSYLMGDYATAYKCSLEAAKRIPTGILGMITSAEHVYYTALTLAAAPSAFGGDRSRTLDELRSLQDKLAIWARYCPQNFAHKTSLVAAEIARLNGQFGEAMICYRSALDNAERHKFLQDAALAHELRARFLFGENEPELAQAHLRLAHEGYRRWGANVKVSALERDYPDCFAPELAPERRRISIDAMALIKASQAISAETAIDNLLEQILRIVVEVAGAQKGALVLSTDGLLTVRAQIEATDEPSILLTEKPLAQCADLSPMILRFVMRTREVLLLPDAAAAGAFKDDPVVKQRGLRSIMCVPLAKRATVIGLLYLENNALTGAFANELVEVVQVLAAQAVISLENSTLVGELRDLTAVLEERVIERTRQLTDEIAERDKAQVALRQLSKTLERRVAERTSDRNALWQLTRDLMLRCTVDGRITAVNPAWTEILGWQEHELVGISLFDFVHPDDFDRTVQGVNDLKEGRSHERFDNRYRHRDGSYRWISWATRSSEGLITATGRDVTVEIEQAQALANTEAQLRQSQKMEAVGQLTGGLAHDFNNLLAGISGSLEMMQARVQQGRHQELDRYMVAARGAAKRAAALTHRLLAFSRRQNLAPKPTDANRLVVGMHDMIQRTVGPAISVEVVGARELWSALVDPPQLENALLNLCLNARDAMPDGGKITIETANKWFDERAAQQLGIPEGQYLSLCVTDTGSGMSAETISRAFEPFYTTKPLGKGTGLGLSMIYGFAQQSGGQVRIHSEVGQGTTVCIFLPRHHGSVDDDLAGEKVSVPRSTRGGTVLVVDDEPVVRMLLTDTLAELGYSSLEAADSATGLKILESNTPIDLLITDVGLPGGMNGRQMADAARVQRPDLTVLFITGYAENAVLGNGYLEQGMSVVTKPFPVEVMAARIRTLMEENASQRA